MKSLIITIVAFFSTPLITYAHCPLCTAGAAAAGGVAAWLGISSVIIGVFIGGASLLMGWWLAKKIKRKLIPAQDSFLAMIIYLSIVLPIYPTIGGHTSLYISWFGHYGSLFHNTYLINLFLLGSVVGAIVVLIAPGISRLISNLSQGRRIPFQGVVVTLFLLTVASLVLELII